MKNSIIKNKQRPQRRKPYTNSHPKIRARSIPPSVFRNHFCNAVAFCNKIKCDIMPTVHSNFSQSEHGFPTIIRNLTFPLYSCEHPPNQFARAISCIIPFSEVLFRPVVYGNEMDPLHQFVISPIFKINLAGIDLSFTNSALAVFVAVMCVFLLFSLGLREKNIIPGRLQSLLEMMFNLVSNLLSSNIGKEGVQYAPFVFSIFVFILLGNLLGMVPYMFTFTSHIIVTFTLGLIVISAVTLLGVARHGAKFFTIFVPKGLPPYLSPFLIPIEVISYMTRPVSLAIRLFANMMAGHTMMKVFASFAIMLGAAGVVPIVANVVLTGFEVVIAILQAYVFTILTCVYLNDAVHLH